MFSTKTNKYLLLGMVTVTNTTTFFFWSIIGQRFVTVGQTEILVLESVKGKKNVTEFIPQPLAKESRLQAIYSIYHI